MKKKTIYLVMLPLFFGLATSSCRQDEKVQWFDSSERLVFGYPAIDVETKSEFRNSLKEGDKFGVLGYCVPYNYVGSSTLAYTNASATWSSKRIYSPPHVFYGTCVTVGASGCTYDYTGSTENNPAYWFRYEDGTGYGLDGTVNSSVTDDAADYRYTFYAYYPFDKFSIVSPKGNMTAGAPVLRFDMPQTGESEETILDDEQTPDAMLGVLYDKRREEGALQFRMYHVLTGLGFEVNNLSERDLTVYSIKLQGSFFKSVQVDFTESVVSYSFPPDRYTGTYELFNGTLELLSTPEGTSSSDLLADGTKYILLISGEGSYFGDDVEVVIDYQFGDAQRTTTSFSRPGTFTPSPGVRYTAQLNFVGDTFVLQFITDNNDMWEDGEGDDGDDGNDDIVFE